MKARREDLPRVVELMRELAEFEKLLDQFEVTAELLERHLFGDGTSAELLVGYAGGEICGYALFFQNFSTFMGRPGMYLEDIYVEPQARGIGLGKALLLKVIRTAVDRGCPRCDWVVLDWNERAKRFYESLGAKPLNDWTVYRMDDAAMKALLADEPSER
jgi:GNAT superfamily N-acetyltransferase